METKLHGQVDLTNEEYHGGPGVSKSHLDWIAPELDRTPLHYWNKYINPDREPEPDTPATLFGSACHIAILEPDLLNKHVVRGLDVERRSTADKFAWAQFEEENAGKIILKREAYDRVLLVRDKVHSHPTVGPLLRSIKTEQSFYTTDKETGELIKCRFDGLAPNGAYSLDLKSTECSSPRAFGKSVANFRYDVQPPWYEDIFDDLYGDHPPYWMFVVFEKEPPFACGLYYATDESRRLGRMKARRDLRLIAECRANGFWPDHAIEAQALQLPRWYARDEAA